MRNVQKLALISALVTAVSSCTFSTQEESTIASSDLSSSTAAITNNVSFRGVLKSGLPDQQFGTHVLNIKDSPVVVFLESNDANLILDAYVERTVEARGSAEPAGIRGETLLRTQEISVLEDSMSSLNNSMQSSSLSTETPPNSFACGGFAGLACLEGYVCTDDLSDECDPKAGGADCIGVCVALTEKPIASSTSSTSSNTVAPVLKTSSLSSSKTLQQVTAISSSASSQSEVLSLPSSFSSSSQASSLESLQKKSVEEMAKQNYSAGNLWTQKYCTTHIGYCVSAHKNWYYKSFGATTSSSWHVEFGMSEIESLGSGNLVMKLLPGSSAASGGSSGVAQLSSGEVIGFKDWGDKHFEISGDASLQAAVSFMLDSIVAYNPAQ